MQAWIKAKFYVFCFLFIQVESTIKRSILCARNLRKEGNVYSRAYQLVDLMKYCAACKVLKSQNQFYFISSINRAKLRILAKQILALHIWLFPQCASHWLARLLLFYYKSLVALNASISDVKLSSSVYENKFICKYRQTHKSVRDL